jgi:hypothetical protein
MVGTWLTQPLYYWLLLRYTYVFADAETKEAVLIDPVDTKVVPPPPSSSAQRMCHGYFNATTTTNCRRRRRRCC